MSDLITIDVDSRQASSVLGRLRARLQDPRQLMRRLQPILENAIETSARTERAIDGSPWAALAPSTLEQKRRLGYGNKRILERTGKSLESIEVAVVGSREIEISHNEIIEYHKRGGGNLPKRSPIPTEDDVERGALTDEIEGTIDDYLNPNLGDFLSSEVARLPLLGRVFRA